MVEYVIVIEFTIFKLGKIGYYLLILCILEVWVEGKKVRIILIIIILFIELIIVHGDCNATYLDLLFHA